MSSQTIEFLESWQRIMYILAPIAAFIGIMVYVAYKLLLSNKKDLKSKYDFVSKFEYKYLFVAHAFIAASIFFLCNNYSHETVLKSFLWFFIRIFISMCVGVLYGYVAQLMLKYYYPAIQAKRLKKYRFTPRVNPANGHTMKLLSEDEEDAYLDEGMQAEENVFSVDYDVWIDSETGDTIIEKYEGRLHALECDRCGFQTLKLEREEIIRQATEHEEGELTKHYKCTYCNRIKRSTVRLSNQKYERDFVINESSRLIDNPLAEDIKVNIVKIEIHGSDESKKNYEFQNLAQAQKFLQEFDYKKLD